MILIGARSRRNLLCDFFSLFFSVDKWNFGNGTFDSILFVLSIRGIFDSVTSRNEILEIDSIEGLKFHD